MAKWPKYIFLKNIVGLRCVYSGELASFGLVVIWINM